MGAIEENLVADAILHQLYHDERIIYPGKLYDVVPVYALLDVLVLPSLREGFPNVLLEAAAMEIPSLASDIPGCRDAVAHDYSGALFTLGDVDLLTGKLEELYRDPLKKKRYGANGATYVKENFSNKKIWNGLLEVYNWLLARKI